MESRFKNLGWKLIDFLFPPSCAGCGKWGSRYCAGCVSKTQVIQPPVCKICGEPIYSSTDSICVNCQRDEIYYHAVRSWARFEPPLQMAIHRLKYNNDVGLADQLSVHLSNLLKLTGWTIDLIAPVPLDNRRMKERGYNQSALLGKSLAALAGLPYSDGILSRVTVTRSQIGLTRAERRTNVKNAFLAEPTLVSRLRILMIDDVITTGSTLNACAKELVEAGAASVYGLTLARSVHL